MADDLFSTRETPAARRRAARATTAWIGFAAWTGLVLGTVAAGPAKAATDFPGVSHTYVADFTKFRFEHVYPSASSLTYTPLNADGSRGPSQTVDVHVEPVGDSLFIVTWQEANKTTVVQVQDYAKKHIHTHLTLPDGTFLQLQGSFTPVE